MSSIEELMLIFRAKDEVSGVTGQIDNEIQSMASSAQQALANMTAGMASISTVSDNLIGSLNSGKSASELIFGTASKAETNKVLVNNMTETKEAAKDLYDTVDKVTDSSLTSMQDLIPALNAFKAATGASDEEIKDITDDMANFGAAVLAQTGSTALAETAMMSLSKGIKGAYAALDQYGVSEDALKRTGKWSGDEKDVRGFMDAVTEVMGSTEALMETNQGLDALIQKAFSRGGKKIGNEFLPIIKDVKRAFIDLDNSLGGNLTAGILVAGEAIDVVNGALFNVSTAVRGISDLKDGVKGLASWAKGILGIGDAAKEATDALHGMSDAMSTVSNSAEMGADLTGMGAMGADAAGAAKGASKGEKAAEGAGDALLMADMLKDNKSANKTREEIIKEIKTGTKYQNKIQEEMDYLQTAGSNFYTTYQSKFKEMVDKKLSLSDVLNPFGKDFNKRAKEEAKNSIKDIKESSKLQKSIQDEMDMVFEKSGWGIGDAIKNKLGGFKTSIVSAFDSLMDFDLKGKITSPFKSIASSIKGFNFGESLQGALEKGFGGLGSIASGIKGKISNFTKSISSISVSGIKGKFSNLSKSLYQSISSFSIGDAFSGLKDKLKGLKGAKDATKGIEEVAEVGSAMGAMAPAAETAAAGAEAGAAATTTLSGAFTSMIVPALALAAVVAIMIPIVAGLAAEAMVFIKLLGEFMQALHFEDIDLNGSIEGLKQIATGLAYVAAAMLAMTTVSLLVGINTVISLFTGITGPLKTAVGALKEAATHLKEFESVQIDPSVGTHLKTISDSLMAVSSAMLALTSVNITTAFAGLTAFIGRFKGIGGALDKAKNEIMEASKKLQDFAGLQPLDSGVAQNIQNVCNSLDSVGKAMSALRSIRDSQNWDDIFGKLMSGLFGEGVDIGTALANVKTDIYNAANALQSWTGLPEVPQDVGSKIQQLSDALGSIKSGLESLKSVAQAYDGGFVGWVEGGLFGGTDIQGAIDKAINEINQVANKLSNIQIANIPDLSFIQRVSVGLSYLKQAGMQLSQFSGFTIPDGVSENVRKAVETVGQVASQLSGMNTTSIGDVNGLLNTINTALNSIRETLSNAGGGFAAPAMNIGSQIVSGVQSGLAPLGGAVQSAVSSAINSATGAASSGGQNLGTQTTEGFRSTLKLADVMNSEMGYVKSAVDSGISAAVSAAQSGAEKVVQAFKDGINHNSPGDIAKTMRAEMGYTNQFLSAAFGPLTTTARELGLALVDSFGNPSLDVSTSMNPLTPTQLQNMGQLTTPVSTTTPASSTTVIVQEGAIQIDARNMTTKEARQLLILAFESLDLYDPNPGAA